MEQLDSQIRAAASKLLIPLQTTRAVEPEAFAELAALTKTFAGALRDRDMVSKSLLNEIYTTIRVLRNEAPHHTEPSVLVGMADQLEMTFSLILLGETPADRTPGIPRII